MKKIPVAEATTEQLRAFAEIQNLPVDDGKKKANAGALIEMLKTGGWDKDFIFAEEAPAYVQGMALSTQGADWTDPEKTDNETKTWLKVTVRISAAEGETGMVPLGCNGVQILVPRNTDAIIPYRYYESLAHARQTVYSETESGLGEGQVIPSYAFNVVRITEDLELKATYLAQKEAVAIATAAA